MTTRYPFCHLTLTKTHTHLTEVDFVKFKLVTINENCNVYQLVNNLYCSSEFLVEQKIVKELIHFAILIDGNKFAFHRIHLCQMSMGFG